MIIDIARGEIIVRGPDEILGTTNDVFLTPHQARVVATGVDESGNPVVAEGLRRAAGQAEIGMRT